MGYVYSLMIPAGLAAMCVAILWRPAAMIRYFGRGNPDLRNAAEEYAWFARLVGACGLAIAVYALVVVVRSFAGR